MSFHKTTDNNYNRTYIAVSYGEKEDAKILGAKWDREKRCWYAPNNEPELLEKYPIKKEKIKNFKNKNINFGGNRLFVDLIPRSCFFTNARYCIHPGDWERVKNYVHERAESKCECCQSRKNLETHERWHYNNKTETQKLMRLIALCQQCHQSTHMGYANTQGRGNEAKKHLKKVRKFTDDEVESHVIDAFDIWSLRNNTDWHLDLSLLIDNGIRLTKTVDKKYRRQISENRLFELNRR